jgi:hypothetical protein
LNKNGGADSTAAIPVNSGDSAASTDEGRILTPTTVGENGELVQAVVCVLLRFSSASWYNMAYGTTGKEEKKEHQEPKSRKKK